MLRSHCGKAPDLQSWDRNLVLEKTCFFGESWRFEGIFEPEGRLVESTGKPEAAAGQGEPGGTYLSI